MYQKEMRIAIELAREASAIAMEIYGRDFDYEEKSDDGGPVTEADLRINEFLTTRLSEAFPDDAVIGEESDLSKIQSNVHRRWIIDPIDGTKDFLLKNGEFSVMIGLAVDGRAELGVVAEPAYDRVYCGAPGMGAFVLDKDNRQTELYVDISMPLEKATLVNSRNHPDPTIDKIRDALGITNEYQHGSVGCKIARIADGSADLYVNLSGRCHWWDVCGPEAIMRQAAGVLLTIDGKELRYEGTDTLVRESFFAANAAIKDAVIAAAKHAL